MREEPPSQGCLSRCAVEVGLSPCFAGPYPVAEVGCAANLRLSPRTPFRSLRRMKRLAEEGVLPVRPLIDGLFSTVAPMDDHEWSGPGIRTGFAEYDRVTGGLVAGKVAIVSARRGVGKTCFTMNMAQWAALNLRVPAFLAVFDTNLADYGQRLLAAEARIDVTALMAEALEPLELAQAESARERLSRAPLTVMAQEGVALEAFSEHVRQWRAGHAGRPAVLMVDTLQLLGTALDASEEHVRRVMATLRQLAADLQVAVIATSNATRADLADPISESDLIGWQAIRDSADSLTLIWRDGDLASLRYMDLREPKCPSAQLHFMFHEPWQRFYAMPYVVGA